jgi:DNA-binding NtrC family response regulator
MKNNNISNNDFKLNILIVDDEEIIRNEISEFLSDIMYKHYLADNPTTALTILKQENIDIVFLDINLPEMSGIELLKIIKTKYPDIEIIMITGQGDMDRVIDSMRAGAMDFFNKPLRLFELQASIERSKKYIKLKKQYELISYSANLLSQEMQSNIGKIVGKSKVIQEAINSAIRVSQSNDTSVIITGPSGSGKELIARTIHFGSSRKNNYFYPLNCSAIPETLFESELFGYKKGAFTGAHEDKKGCFEASNNGTLFLDEIGDMPLNHQSKILRVLEDKKVKRIGSNNEIDVNVRIVSATHRNIEDMIKSEDFRLDLYYRLNTYNIHIPGLSERREDIPVITEYYVDYFAQKLNKQIDNIDDKVYELLDKYDFPGNVRELKNIIERAVILSDGKILKNNNIILNKSIEVAASTENNFVSDKNEIFNLEEIEKERITAAMKKTDNNKTAASKLLNISWFALNRKLKKYNLI